MGKKRAGRGGIVKKIKDPSLSALKSLSVNPMQGIAEGLEDIKLPPKPDPSVSYPWPSHDFKVLQECDQFFKIYPTYLDADKTVKLGRRLPISKCVPGPTVMEISECLQSLRLRHVIEPHKGYSRDVESRWYNPGRVLVDKKQRGIIPIDQRYTFHTKMDILKEVAFRLPNAPSRLRRIEKDKQQAALEAAKPVAPPTTVGPTNTTNSASGSSRMKKGKKGRR